MKVTIKNDRLFIELGLLRTPRVSRKRKVLTVATTKGLRATTAKYRGKALSVSVKAVTGVDAAFLRPPKESGEEWKCIPLIEIKTLKPEEIE